MSIRVGDTIIAGGGIPINKSALYLFDFKWSDHLVNQQQWLRADTFTFHDGSVYSEAYQHLVDDIQGKTLQSETISGVTVQFYRADDDHKICPASEETNVAQIYINTGVAWYYILDTDNQQFKLPRTEYNVVGVRSSAGDYVEAGLPNITGRYTNDVWGWGRIGVRSTAGALSGTDYQTMTRTMTNIGQYNVTNTGTGTDNTTVVLDASHSSTVYGNSDTVQPPATQMYLYFFIGDFTQTATEQTAGLNAELFNGKADVSTTYTKAETDNLLTTTLNTIYPVGSIYIGTQATCPMSTLISGSTWELVSAGRTLQGSDNSHSAGSTIEAGLPNITGRFVLFDARVDGEVFNVDGSAGSWPYGGSSGGKSWVSFDASRSSSIYGNNTTVQPAAYVVNIWRRTA